MSLCFRWMSEVAMKMWIPGRFAFSTARMARSTSCSRVRASERTIGFTTAAATRRTDSKSPSEEAAKPASITSTPRCSSWRALAALSGLVKHDRAHGRGLRAGGGLQRASGQTAHQGHERPGERIAPDAEEEHHLGRPHGQVDEDDQPEQDRERMAVMEADLLERVVPDLAHHEPRHRADHEQP